MCGGRADRRVRLPGLELKMLTEKACAATKHYLPVKPPQAFRGLINRAGEPGAREGDRPA